MPCAPDTPGLGIAWRWDEIERRARERTASS